MPSSSSIPPPTAPLFPYTTLFRSQEADPPRLSRFLNYNNTCGSNNDVLCVALNEPGYSFSLLIDDPDNVTSFVSVNMTSRFYENDGEGNRLTKTYTGPSANQWLRVHYTPPPAIVDRDMSTGAITVPFGTMTITQGPAGGAIIPGDNRFEIHFRMTRPYNATKSIRGWIRSTSTPNEIPKVFFD